MTPCDDILQEHYSLEKGFCKFLKSIFKKRLYVEYLRATLQNGTTRAATIIRCQFNF